MASNRSNGLLWSLIGPAIWMALLLSVLSGQSEGAVSAPATHATPETVVGIEAPDPPVELTSTLHAWAGCLESFNPFPSEDGA